MSLHNPAANMGDAHDSYQRADPSTSPTQNGYEELFGDTVPCPTCRGTGRLPKERENELVALIPYRDKRLRPRRTMLWVCLAVTLCILVGGLTAFFMFPRSIQLLNHLPNIKPHKVYINVSQEYVFIQLINVYEIKNDNFFGVTVKKLFVTATFDQKVMAEQVNITTVYIPMRSTTAHYIQMNITFNSDEGYIAYYCSDKIQRVHTLLMPFQATANSYYLGHSENSTLQTYQHVQCNQAKKARLSTHVSR